MATIVAPTSLEEDAYAATLLADKLDALYGEFAHADRSLLWAGPSADQYQARMKPILDGMQTRADGLRHVANLLRAGASAAQSERAALVADQDDAERILQSSKNPAALLRQVGYTDPSLPPTGSTEWRELHQKLALATRPATYSGGAPL